MKRLAIKIFFIGSGMLGIWAGSATAAYGAALFAPICTGSNSPYTGNIPLQISSLTVPRDTPNGSVIYRQSLSTPSTAISCSGLSAFSYYNQYSAQQILASSTGSTGSYIGVSDTGVTGIGWTITIAGTQPQSGLTPSVACAAIAACTINAQNSQIELILIKTGNISAGTVQGSSLGTISGNTFINNNILYSLFILGFSGSINIVSQTCQTPDVQVNMGTHKVGELSGINSTTAWTPFTIALLNCPAFQSTNSLQYRVDPTTTITAVNSTNGILSINAGAQGMPSAASGVGLQIGYGSGTPLPLATLRASGVVLNSQAGSSYSIPLMARYIQIGNTLSAGPANATATFTLSYQ
ncbi:fimbrial protein [Pseudomonas sp. 1912-s]|uniref:fimbrial protein n=1 Tax=Pseudomonas sp. 1912-s TaxID=3033802 RepID=UPI0023DFF0C2|nr:fimbrial protein [Pseudomonas sp. 1912-s]MDF3201799.1 fimbrial protein [Pseudomonas sp. 1912-s]